MTAKRHTHRLKPFDTIVRRIMRKHGLTEPSARVVAALAYGEGRQDG